MTKTVGPKIKKLRLEKGITQKEFAKLLGYAYPSTLSEIENGIKGIDANKILKASKILNVDVNDILNDDILDTRNTEGETSKIS